MRDASNHDYTLRPMRMTSRMVGAATEAATAFVAPLIRAAAASASTTTTTTTKSC
jgi:hypothetical protein